MKDAVLLHAQDAADVQKPEDLLHRLQQLQQDSLQQNEQLAQATAAADSLRGGLSCERFNVTRVLPAVTADHSTGSCFLV